VFSHGLRELLFPDFVVNANTNLFLGDVFGKGVEQCSHVCTDESTTSNQRHNNMNMQTESFLMKSAKHQKMLRNVSFKPTPLIHYLGAGLNKPLVDFLGLCFFLINCRIVLLSSNSKSFLALLWRSTVCDEMLLIDFGNLLIYSSAFCWSFSWLISHCQF